MKLKPVTRVNKTLEAKPQSWASLLQKHAAEKSREISIVLGIFVVLALVVFGKAVYSNSKEKDASRLFLTAKNAEEYQLILRNYPKTEAAPLAAYSLGVVLQDGKNWEGAETAFRDFIALNKDHILYPQAALGLAFALENQGKWDQAKTLYNDLLADPAVSQIFSSEIAQALGRIQAASQK